MLSGPGTEVQEREGDTEESSKYKEEGQGTWSSSERRHHFNGMVIRKGGVPALVKEEDKERSSLSGDERVDNSMA